MTTNKLGTATQQQEDTVSAHNLLKWSEEYEANEDIRYNHVLADSPIGKFSIEWKGWKENDVMTIYLDEHYLDCADTLEKAKEAVDIYLISKTDQLNRLFTKLKNTTQQNSRHSQRIACHMPQAREE